MNDRYKRSIVTALILSAVLSPFVFFSSPLKSWQNPPRAVVLLQDAIYPFEWAWSQSVDSLMSGIKRYVYLSNAAHENEDLRSTLGSMQSRIMDYEEQLLENERLRRLLGFANRSEKSMVAAEVIGHNSLSQFESIRISRGESDGIRNGMPVVSADGVVGKVIRTGFKFADVQLLVDTDFHIDVLLQRTRVRGVLAGDSNAWSIFSKNYLEELEKNLQGKDQVIYRKVLNNSNSLIIQPNDKYGDPWFFLTYIFSY